MSRPNEGVDPEDQKRLDAIAGALEVHREPARLSALEGVGMLLATCAACLIGLEATGPLAGVLLGVGAASGTIGAWQRKARATTRREARREQAIAEIGAIESPRAVGRLLEIAGAVEERGRGEVLDAVGRLIPQLDREMADALTTAQLDALRTLLVPASGALSFSPEVERRRGLAVILRIMARRGHQPARREARILAERWRTPEVRDAALACLVRLDHMAAAAKLSGTLLRPAEAPVADRLLRPAEPVGEELLLRPARGDDE